MLTHTATSRTIPLLLLFVINFLLGRRAGLSYGDGVSLSLTKLARNSPVSLALALVIDPMIELPVLGLVTQVLLLIKGKLARK